jgi:hypothetical protein
VKEFDYKLNYKRLDFTDQNTRKLYRIGRGEQGVLLVRPYTDVICQHWRFRTPTIAQESADKIYNLFTEYLKADDFIGADMARKFLEMGFTRARRYANHHTGKKYNDNGEILPQESDHATCHYAKSASVFLEYRRKAASDVRYQTMRKQWRNQE